MSDRITPEIHLALMRALRSSTKFLGIIPRVAQGIEAQSATTAGRGPKDESPVAKPCAQPLSKQSGG
jgi:hypothetical protein